MDELRRESGATVVLVTHDPAIAARADRRITIRDGKVIGDESGR
jgi:putative ABC transport system ATP-binding protein